MINRLILMTGNDIPFREGNIIIHPPTLKEIGVIGEDTFLMGCQLLNFSKDILSEKDKSHLSNKSNFEIFMSMMSDTQSIELLEQKQKVFATLFLLFPNYTFKFIPTKGIVFYQEENQCGEINESNYELFKKYIVEIFCLSKATEGSSYNPAGEKARQLAEKFKKRHQKLAELKGNNSNEIAIFSRYASILSIGMKIPLQEVLQNTIYQLLDLYNRFELKEYTDYYLRACLAGAKGMKEPEDWMKDIYEN